MIEEWPAALEATPLATALRGSVWVYPLVNAAHILGVALLVGSIVPLDLRLLGVWRSVPLTPLWGVLTRTAGAGLILAMIFGALLFITRASEYTASNLFISKMAVVALGTANALALRVLPQTQVSEITSTKGKPPARRWHIARYVAYRPDVGTSDRLLLKQSVFVDAAAKEAVVRGLGSGQSMHRQGIKDRIRNQLFVYIGFRSRSASHPRAIR